MTAVAVGLPMPMTLSELEARVERGLSTFVDVGLALLEIRDRRLYRDTHGTFEDYCRERWSMERAQAYRLIDAAQVTAVLSPIGDRPINEAQARELAPLRDDPETMREVWAEVTESGETVTAERVREAVQPRVNPLFSSASPEWYTPPHIIAAVRVLMGHIDLDPCADAGRSVPASNHFTAADDGLTHPWVGRVYMNPPYGDVIDAWAAKLCGEFAAGRTTAAVALVPARVDTAWFRRFGAFPVCFVRGRLRFSDAAAGAPFPSALFALGIPTERFAQAFAEVGDTYVRAL